MKRASPRDACWEEVEEVERGEAPAGRDQPARVAGERYGSQERKQIISRPFVPIASMTFGVLLRAGDREK